MEHIPTTRKLNYRKNIVKSEIAALTESENLNCKDLIKLQKLRNSKIRQNWLNFNDKYVLLFPITCEIFKWFETLSEIFTFPILDRNSKTKQDFKKVFQIKFHLGPTTYVFGGMIMCKYTTQKSVCKKKKK